MSDQESKYVLNNAPIFKGATRPPCVLGIPITPFVFVAGGILIASLVIWIPLVLSLIPSEYLIHAYMQSNTSVYSSCHTSSTFLAVTGTCLLDITLYSQLFIKKTLRDNKCKKNY